MVLMSWLPFFSDILTEKVFSCLRKPCILQFFCQFVVHISLLLSNSAPRSNDPDTTRSCFEVSGNNLLKRARTKLLSPFNALSTSLFEMDFFVARALSSFSECSLKNPFQINW